VAEFFVSLLYPAEGQGNLEHYRAAANEFLNSSDDGALNSPFSALSPNSPVYDQRVRGMVAMLMSFQRFQEQ
jgi:hypothetical protein